MKSGSIAIGYHHRCVLKSMVPRTSDYRSARPRMRRARNEMSMMTIFGQKGRCMCGVYGDGQGYYVFSYFNVPKFNFVHLHFID